MQRIFLFYPFINAEFGSNPQKLCHDFPKVLGKKASVYLFVAPLSPNLHRFSAFENTRGKVGVSMHLFLLLLYYYYYYYYYKRHKSNTQKKWWKEDAQTYNRNWVHHLRSAKTLHTMTLRELAGAHQMIFTLLVPPLQVMYPNPV